MIRVGGERGKEFLSPVTPTVVLAQWPQNESERYLFNPHTPTPVPYTLLPYTFRLIPCPYPSRVNLPKSSVRYRNSFYATVEDIARAI
jgi:hypothetical protein